MHKKFLRTSTALAAAPLLGIILLVNQSMAMEELNGKTITLKNTSTQSYIASTIETDNPDNPPKLNCSLIANNTSKWQVQWDLNLYGFRLQNRKTRQYLTMNEHANLITDKRRNTMRELWTMVYSEGEKLLESKMKQRNFTISDNTAIYDAPTVYDLLIEEASWHPDDE